MFKKWRTLLLMIACYLCLSGCSQEKDSSTLTFGISAEYPPFEFYQDGQIVGFDIDLAKLIGEELHKEIIFQDMQFSTLLAALGSGQIDAAISTITITPEREQSFDFSEPYYFEGLAAVFPKNHSIASEEELAHKNIATLFGSTMEIWLKKHVPTASLVLVDSTNQAIETLKAGHVDCAVVDAAQAIAFSEQNPELAYAIVAQAEEGHGIAIRKKSPLKKEFDQALKQLEERGEIQKLKEKWLKHGSNK